MYELVQLADNTYYIEGYAKMGLYIKDKAAFLIDSGIGDEAGRAVYEEILQPNGWQLQAVINTHIHCDHIGGNSFLQSKTGCQIFTTLMEGAFARYRELEYAYLAGGFPCQTMRETMLLASPSRTTDLIENGLPEGLTALPLPGHYFNMQGIKTIDEVWFLADSLLSEKLVAKYRLFFIYDVKAQLETLKMLETLKGRLFVPSHAEPQTDLSRLIRLNREAIEENSEIIWSFCRESINFDNLLKKVFDYYGIPMDLSQYSLVGSTVRSYLAYLYDRDKAEVFFKDNKMYWQAK